MKLYLWPPVFQCIWGKDELHNSRVWSKHLSCAATCVATSWNQFPHVQQQQSNMFNNNNRATCSATCSTTTTEQHVQQHVQQQQQSNMFSNMFNNNRATCSATTTTTTEQHVMWLLLYQSEFNFLSSSRSRHTNTHTHSCVLENFVWHAYVLSSPTSPCTWLWLVCLTWPCCRGGVPDVLVQTDRTKMWRQSPEFLNQVVSE